MVDNLSKQQRSDCMSQIKSTNTKVELFLRKELWKNGIKGYRLKTKIYGRPDLYFPKKRLAVFVDGCFWHMCPKCYKPPKSNIKYWGLKIKKNITRDRRVEKDLKQNGINVLRFWEHDIKKNPKKIIRRINHIYKKEVSAMNVVDLFAGCGGLSKGFELAGFNVILGVDSDSDSRETFLFNHKNSEYLLKDIKTVNAADIRNKIGDKKVDLLIGGPPCQGFSVSGKRAFLDPRNSLYKHYFRIVDLLKPKAVLIENVPGLKSLYDGKVLLNIEREFKKRGYKVAHKVVKADDYGVPQTRKRIVIVGTKCRDYKFSEPKLKKVILGEAISDLPCIKGSEEKTEYTSPPLNKYQKTMRVKSSRVYNHAGTNHSEKTRRIIHMVPEGGNYKALPRCLQKTRKVHIAWTRLNSKKPSPTIDTGHRHHFHPWEDRVPTVRESARIQSFPDTFIFKGSKTSQYRQVGNAVPPMLAFEIAKSIKRWFLEK
jgi:DNA (cytosine-5)-methyltransferase 1